MKKQTSGIVHPVKIKKLFMKLSIIIFSVLLAFVFTNCQNKMKSKKPTPEKFKSIVKVPSLLYTNDSTYLAQVIKQEIREHTNAFYSKEYDISTKIFIDTIMYSPDFDKMVFFIINENKNANLYKGMSKEEAVKIIKENNFAPYDDSHFNGNAYIGFRKSDSLAINDFFRIQTSRYQTYSNLKKRLHQIFFEEYSAVDERGFEYNIDDVRFWSNKNVWEKIK